MSSSPTPPPSTAPRARPPTPATSLLGEHTTAAAAYVAMTRGRERQHRPPGRRGPRRRPAAMGRDLRPRPRRPRARARRPARSRGPRTVRPPPPPRGRTGRPACRLDHRTRPTRRLGPLREPPRLHGGRRRTSRSLGLRRPRERTSSVTSSPPPPTRCAPASTNPPSGPCHRAASSRNTPTGSSTAEHEQQAAQAGWETSPIPGPGHGRPPSATRAHLTEAEASADDPHHRSTPTETDPGEHLVSHVVAGPSQDS